MCISIHLVVTFTAAGRCIAAAAVNAERWHAPGKQTASACICHMLTMHAEQLPGILTDLALLSNCKHRGTYNKGSKAVSKRGKPDKKEVSAFLIRCCCGFTAVAVARSCFRASCANLHAARSPQASQSLPG